MLHGQVLSDGELCRLKVKSGGESGIRTHVRVSPKHAFQACAFSHSAISPLKGSNVGLAELFQDPLLAMLSLDCTGRNYFGANQGAISPGDHWLEFICAIIRL